MKGDRLSTSQPGTEIEGILRSPGGSMLCAIGLAGGLAAVVSFTLAQASDHVNEPGLQGALMDWIIVPYILGGLVAWWRRPESRFGPLMVAAGFVAFVSTLGWANTALPFTIGQAFDLLPAVLYLHVFLAFPSGRLQSASERALVVAGYFVAFGLELVGLMLGGFGDQNLLEAVSAPEAANALLRVQLVLLSAFSLAGVVVLVLRWRGEGLSMRRPMVLLVDCFALGLVMIAALFLTAAFEGPAFETIRRATFVVIGLAPAAFLVGL